MKKGDIIESNEIFYTIEKIAQALIQKLSQKMIFSAKLKNTKVNVVKTISLTQGYCKCSDENNLEIGIEYNPNDRKELIELIIAHELSHLLFSIFSQYSDFCHTDESMAVSSIKRKYNGGIYGAQLEESLCDYIAIDIVCNLHKEITKEQIISIYDLGFKNWRFTKRNYILVEQIVNMCSTTDINTNDNYDSLIETESGKLYPRNMLLYGAICGSLNPLIYEYDELMGFGSWKEFNKKLDTFMLDNSKIDVLNQIETEISKFKKISE